VISAVQMAAVLFQAKMIIGINEMIVSYSQYGKSNVFMSVK